MNQQPLPNPPVPSAHSRAPLAKVFASLTLFLFAAVAGYSVYVAVHEPDPQETVILGQTKLTAGEPAGLRILVRNRMSGKPLPGAKVQLLLSGKATGAIKLGTFRTDARGSLVESIEIPELPPGPYELSVTATSAAGRDVVVRKIDVRRLVRVALSSDKPLYQPGQTIRLRTLVLEGRTGRPFAEEAVTFEIADPKGNKVFKEIRRTSAFGIASADFALASELNLGRYEIRVIAGGETTERSVEIKRYTLPKFNVHLQTDRPYYLPGETVSGSVAASYFFGKSVGNATVKLTASTYEDKPAVLRELEGRTDLAGHYAFRFQLPDSLVGMPQRNEQAFLDLTAEVRDAAGHVEEKVLSLSVAQHELEVTVIPEGGALVPGIENLLYILTAYPDGRPAECKLFVNGSGYQGGAQGLCEVRVVPAASNIPFEIQALDRAGRRRQLTYRSDRPAAAFLLRSDKAVYQAGETARFSVLSTEKRTTIFLDVIKDGQTVLVRSVPLEDHQAQTAFALPASLTGTLSVHAYFITEAGEDRGCTRVIYVNPASGLRVAARLSQPVYHPGEIARLDFSVTDAEGRPTPAALGIAAVDESVFALNADRPGLLRQFLAVEGELLKPRYQTKFFACPERLFENQALAAAYLASLEEASSKPTIHDLVRSGDVSPRAVEQARAMRGTPAYERFQSDPAYADVIRLLEGEQGAYTLRAATGPIKVQMLEAQRKAYFSKLRRCLKFGFLGLLFASPILLLAWQPRSARISLAGVVIAITMMLVLGSMLMPALAKAKAKSTTIRLSSDLRQIYLATQTEGKGGAEASASAPPRVRRDFPETLLWRPELVTDDRGQATLEIPLADSITTWRASVDAVSAAGKLGGVEVPITVFQDFFVDLDLPISMSLGDEISVPVTCYNYLQEPQDVRFTLATRNWFECSTPDHQLQLGPNEVKSVSFPIRLLRVGSHSLRVTAQGTKTADAIEREVRVVPTGDRFEQMNNGVLKAAFADTLTVPAGTIPDSATLWVKFYPSRFSEVVEGLDAVFQAPYGCFEQTSSTTYPNVLVLDYMKRHGRLAPEVEIKARKFINAGYQRLLTFEVAGGGFEWFGRDPANVCLTAYGILEFTDMARVHPVDTAVIQRARQWLFAQQHPDGSWDENHRGETWFGRGSMTGFVAWALAEAGDQSPDLDQALGYLRAHPQELSNTYAKALAANALLARNRNDTFGRGLAAKLLDAAIADGEAAVHWSSAGHSVTYSHGPGMDTECTALCAMALMKAGTSPQSVKRALTWISTRRFANGTHGSTQATILAMRALLEASGAPVAQEFESTVTLLLNGQGVETFHVDRNNSDVMRQIDLTRSLRVGENRFQMRQDPPGDLPFQVVGTYWIARPGAVSDAASPGGREPLRIDLDYDRTTLPMNDQLGCTVTVRNSTPQVIHMAIVDLGIPPGFDVDAAAFELLQEKGQIAKFDVTGNQVILYLRELSNETPLRFGYSLRAKYPLRVQTPPSAVYEYYQPQNRAQAQAVTLEALGN